ncbi:hypothetical protein ACLI4Z_05435 [Natrialbaceae archaeon A-arb3/5]
MSDGEQLISAKSLAATYDGGTYEDAWSAVDQYRRATEYASTHDAGSAATATALDLPRGQLRAWIDGDGKPDVVRGIEAARDYGWLDCTYGNAEFTALNALVANVFSSGSIAQEYYRPSFTINHLGESSHVFDALELAGVEYKIIDDRDGRADEVRPTKDETVLGRVLASLGAPVGPKAEQHLSLPSYLEGAPKDTREMFVYAYLENRAVEHGQKATLTIQEQRNREYLADLAALIKDVAGGGVNLRENNIVISADATRRLGQVR